MYASYIDLKLNAFNLVFVDNALGNLPFKSEQISSILQACSDLCESAWNLGRKIVDLGHDIAASKTDKKAMYDDYNVQLIAMFGFLNRTRAEGGLFSGFSYQHADAYTIDQL